jgi:hypothetical protein
MPLGILPMHMGKSPSCVESSKTWICITYCYCSNNSVAKFGLAMAEIKDVAVFRETLTLKWQKHARSASTG